MTEVEPVEERWTYGGRRFSAGTGKIFHVWRDAAGQERNYGKASASVPGGVYTVRVSKEGGHTYLHGEPAWTGEVTEDTVAAKATDERAWRELDAHRRHKRAGQLTELDRVVEDLAEHVRAYADIEPILDAVRHRLIRELGKRAKT